MQWQARTADHLVRADRTATGLEPAVLCDVKHGTSSIAALPVLPALR